MKILKFSMVAIAIMAIACIAAPSATAQDCAIDPDACSGPRTWFEDFEDGVPLVPSDDWQARNGTSPQPSYADGKATYDGFTDGPWVITDTADWLFEGKTTVNVVMDANPNVGNLDQGAGWWINADNEQTDGGYYAVYAVLERNEQGGQQYRFGDERAFDNWGIDRPDNLIIPIAEGSGIDATITVTPGTVTGDPDAVPEIPSMAAVTYSVTDSAGTYTGDFLIPPQAMPGNKPGVVGTTLFSFAQGWGVFDSVEIINEGRPPIDPNPGDFDDSRAVGNGDLTLLLDGWGGAPGAGWTNSPPASVGNDSLTVLLDNWGNDYSGGLAAASVPEPSSMAIALLAAIGGLARGRRARQ